MKILRTLGWPTLRVVGQSRVLRSSYVWLILVPIAARFVNQLNSPLSIDLWGQAHSLHLGLPFSWYCFYAAALAFSVASLSYMVFCPEMVKSFGSFRDFYQEGNGARRLSAYYFGLSEQGRSLLLTSTANQIYLTRRSTGTIEDSPMNFDDSYRDAYVRDHFFEIKREDLGDLFTILFAYHSESRPWRRAWTFSWYVLGFSMTTVVLLQNAKFVWTMWSSQG